VCETVNLAPLLPALQVCCERLHGRVHGRREGAREQEWPAAYCSSVAAVVLKVAALRSHRATRDDPQPRSVVVAQATVLQRHAHVWPLHACGAAVKATRRHSRTRRRSHKRWPRTSRTALGHQNTCGAPDQSVFASRRTVIREKMTLARGDAAAGVEKHSAWAAGTPAQRGRAGVPAAQAQQRCALRGRTCTMTKSRRHALNLQRECAPAR
jgi:ribonuclease D